jgi:hypothetical protein
MVFVKKIYKKFLILILDFIKKNNKHSQAAHL